MATFQDTKGKTFTTQAEAAASNTALGTNPSVNINAGVIPVDGLTNQVQPLKLQPTATPTYGGIESSLNTVLTTGKSQAEKDLEIEKQQVDTSLQDLLEGITESGTIASSVDRTAQDASKKKYDQFTSMLEQEQLSNRRAIETLQKTNPRGLFGGALDQEVERLNRDSLSKQADIAILQTAANREYSTASEIADREVEMKTERSRTKLEALKFLYQENKASFNKDEERFYDEQVKKADREYQKEQTLQNDIKNIKLEAAKNNAPLSVLNKLSQAKTVDEAVAAVGSYLMSPMEKLQMEKLRGDIAKNAAELAAAKNTLNGTTGDPVLDIVSASARYGDKRLTDSQLEKIQKATQALGSLETLQGLLNQGKDGLKTSGPVIGRKRTLVSQLGGDADARAINATIQGLIPTIARGIFGEVGVLTDADIANYRKTVPNLNSTEDQNKLVSIVMYDVLSRSLESTLVSNAQNQTNVSGFSSTYQNAKQRINSLKSELGITEPTPISPVNNAKLEAAWGSQFSVENVSNTLNSFLNQ